MADPEDEREVLTSLPRSRPKRRSSKRGEQAEATSADDASQSERPDTAATPDDAPVKTRAAKRRPKPAAQAKRPPPADKAKRPKPAASSETSEPEVSADRPKRKPRQAPSAEPTPTTEATEPPRTPPEREDPSAGNDAPAGDEDGGFKSAATAIVMTTAQAVTELAQIGLSVGRQALRAAFERLPKL